MYDYDLTTVIQYKICQNKLLTSSVKSKNSEAFDKIRFFVDKFHAVNNFSSLPFILHLHTILPKMGFP